MRGPRSYTGEDVAEIPGHGGALNLGRLLRAVLACGARAAEPGEFTRRAFELGRLDLTRAEAVVAVIGAASERALRAAQAGLARGAARPGGGAPAPGGAVVGRGGGAAAFSQGGPAVLAGRGARAGRAPA